MILSKLESEVALRARGVINIQEERISKQFARPVSDHMKEFRASLESSVSNTQHINEVCGTLDRIAKCGDWMSTGSITPESVEKYSAELRKIGRSNRTIQSHISYAKQFTRWLYRINRIQHDPL